MIKHLQFQTNLKIQTRKIEKNKNTKYVYCCLLFVFKCTQIDNKVVLYSYMLISISY